MTDFRWFEVHPPRELSSSNVTALLRVLAGRPHYGLRGLQPVVTFEMWLRPDGVRWLIGIEEQIARTLPGQFVSQVPGLVLTPVSEPERPRPITAREVRFTSLVHPLRLDTAQGVTAGLLQARSELRTGEAVVVQWVVGPSHVHTRQPIRQTPLDLLGITTPPEPGSGERQAWKQKLTEPLLGVRGRLGAVATEPRWAGGLLRPVVSALSLANGAHARIRISQQSSRTADQLTRVIGRARTWSGMLNAAELAALLGWPVNGLEIPGGTKGFAPPPALLLNATKGGRPLGSSTHPATRGSVVRMPFSSYGANCHVIGPPGVGKSTLLANWGLAEVAAGRSVVIIEPKGDLVADVLVRLEPHQHNQTVVIEPTMSGAPVVGFNPLAGPRAEAERRADSVLNVFRELFGTAIGPRSADVLLHALIAVARYEGGTLPDVVALLTNAGFRRRVLGQVSDPLVLAPWAAWFDGLSEAERTQVVAPVLNKLRVMVSRPAIRRLLGGATPRFDLDTVFTMPTVVLVNLNAGVVGVEATKIIGSLLLNLLWEAIQRQTTVPTRKRREVAVIVDEWQDFAAGLDFADVLARARGAKVPFTVGHQHLDQLTPNLRAAVLANARARIVYRPAEGDARTLAKVLGAPVTADDLERLPAFHAVARVLVDDAPSDPFEIATPPLPPATHDANAVRRVSAERYGIDPAELDAAVQRRWEGGDDTPDAPIGLRRKSS
jgi:hypothetical protein